MLYLILVGGLLVPGSFRTAGAQDQTPTATASPSPTPEPTPPVTMVTPLPAPDAVGHPVEVPDLILDRQIRDGLRATRRPQLAGLQVKVEQGVVRLDGTVESYQERALAESVARTLPGVRRVDSHLRLASGFRPRGRPNDRRTLSQISFDEKIRDLVRQRLARLPGLALSRIKVEVYCGVAVISGEVSSVDIANMARETTEFTRGVSSVILHLQIENGSPQTTAP